MGGEGDAEDDGADDVDAVGTGYIPMTKPGDIWHVGQHRVMCGSATDDAAGVGSAGPHRPALWRIV